MATLRYDISVVGLANVQRALASVERRFMAHNAKIQRMLGGREATRPGAGMARMDAMEARAKTQRLAGEQRFAQQRILLEQKTQGQLRAIRERGRVQDERAAARSARRQAATDARSRGQFGRGIARRGVQSVGGAVAGVGRMAAGALAVGGGFALAGALASERQLSKVLTVLANQSYREDTPEVTREQLFNDFKRVAVKAGATGEGALNVAQAMRKFIELTGEPEIGKQLSQTFTDVATATGASIEDVAGVAGESMLLLQQRGVKGAGALDELSKILMTLAAQGKLGSIEFATLVPTMSKIGASTARFGGNVSDLVAQMAAFAQLAKRGGAPSAEEATTALMRMSDDMVQNAKKFKALGIEVFEFSNVGGVQTRTGLRNPMAVFAEVMHQTRGDLQKTQPLFGIRAAKITETMFGMARGLGGGDMSKGMRLMTEEFERLSKATVTQRELSESAAFARAQSDLKLAAAGEQFDRAVGEHLLPAITEVVPEFAKLVPHLGNLAKHLADFIGWFAKNPIKGLGALVLGLVAKDLAMAGIGAAARAAITAALSAAGIGAAAPAVAAGGVAAGGAAAGGVGAVAGRVLLGTAGAAGAMAGLVGAVAASTEENSRVLGEQFAEASLRSAAGVGIDAVRELTPRGPQLSIAGGEVVESAPSIAGSQDVTAAADKMALAGDAQLKAAKSQEAAAKAVFDTATVLATMNMGGGGGMPNRGNVPTSPVAGGR